MSNPIIDFSKYLSPPQADSEKILDFNKIITESGAPVVPETEDFFLRYKRITADERRRVYEAIIPGDSPFLRGVLDTIPSGILNAASLLINPKQGGAGLGAGARSIAEMGAELIPNPWAARGFIEEVKAAGKAAVNLPISLAVGLAAPIKALAEVTVGTQLALESPDNDTNWFQKQWNVVKKAPLTDEDREERGRIVAANVLAFAVAHGAGKVVETKLGGIKPLTGETLFKELSKQKTLPEVMGVIKGSDLEIGRLIDVMRAPFGTSYMRNAARDVAAGGAFGATLGWFESDDPAQAVEAATAFGLIALPLGMAFAAVGPSYSGIKGKPYMDKSEMIARSAGTVAKLRQIQMVMDNTPIEVLSNMENLHTTKSIAATTAAQAIRYEKVGVDADGNAIQYGMGARIVPAVPPEETASVLNIISSKSKEDAVPRKSTLHRREDGMFDVLVTPTDADSKMLDGFVRTGFLEGQQVTFGGNRFYQLEGIEPAGQVPAGVGPVAKIRNMITNDRTQVPLTDLERPNNQHLTELAFDQRRLVRPDDLNDFSQGFSIGENFVSANWFGGGRDQRFNFLDSEIMSDFGTNYRMEQRVTSSGQTQTAVMNGRNLYKELVPGLNEVNVGDHNIVIWMGGKEVEVGGKKMVVGTEGDIVAMLAWEYRDHPNPAVGRKAYSHTIVADPKAPNKWVATKEILDYRGAKGIGQSASTLSPGGKDFLRRTLNKYPELIPKSKSVMGVVDTETLARVTFQDFLDFIGFGAKREKSDLTTTPEAVGVEHMAIPFGTTNPIVAGRNETLANLRDRLVGGAIGPRAEHTQRYFSPADVLGRTQGMGEDVATARLQAELDAGRTPPTSINPQFAPRAMLINADNANFNDMFTAWLQARGVPDNTAPILRQHFERSLGEMLLSDGKSIKDFTDTATIPWLMRRADGITHELEKLANDWGTDDPNAMISHLSQGGRIKFDDKYYTDFDELMIAVEQAEETKAVFMNRATQIQKMEAPALSVDERALLTRLQTDIETTRQAMANHIVHVAGETGHYVTREQGGRINIYDAETHTLQTKFNAEEDAVAWMKKTAQATGMNIDGGAGNNIVPPAQLGSHLVGGPPPLDPPYQVPFNFKPRGRIEKFFDLVNSIPYITVKRGFKVAMDNQFNTKLFADVYVPLQTAAMRRDLAAHSFLERVKELESELVKSGVPREEWAKISDYRESLSPDEIKSKLYRHRPLTQKEVQYADQLMRMGVDIEKIYDYRRTWNDIREDVQDRMSKIAPDDANRQTKVEALQQEMLEKNELLRNKLVMTSDDMQAVNIFQQILSHDPDDARLDAVSRLVRAQQGSDRAFSRQEYLANNKMHPKLVEVAHKIDAFYSDLAKEFGIDESITYYLNHYRTEGEIPDRMVGLRQRNPIAQSDRVTRDFASRLIRSGETAIYDRDPVTALVAYVRAGMTDKHFGATWDAAFTRASEEVNKLPIEIRDKAAKVVGEYLFDMKGYKAESDVFAQAVINHYLDAAKIETDVNLRRDIVHTLLAANSGSFIGFRPAQGVRDLNTFFKIYVTRFGLDRYANGFRLAFKRDAEGKLPIERLAEEGKIPTLSPIMFQTAEELANEMSGKRGRRTIQKAISKFADVGFAATGQPNIYGMSHAIAYLDMRSVAQPEILKLMQNKTTKAAAYEKIGLDTFYRPIAEKFDALVTEGKGNEAVEFLAQQSGIETAFVFGLHNQPYLWGTALGRLIGHYGQWPMWDRNFLQQVASRGTPRQRVAAMKRYALTEAMTFAVGKSVGMNMRSWTLIPGMFFMGGPTVDMVNQVYDMSGARGQRRQDLALSVYGPRIPVLSNFIPGSGAFNDYYQAYKMLNKDFNPASATLRGLGFSINQKHQSLLDEVLGFDPKLRAR